VGLEEHCATVAAVLQSRKRRLLNQRKPSPIPAGALKLPKNPTKEQLGSFHLFNPTKYRKS